MDSTWREHSFFSSRRKFFSTTLQLLLLSSQWSYTVRAAVVLSPSPGSHALKDSLGAVSSESKLCSEIGIELLKRGGNAADAMVGTTLCVGIIGMQHSGIGGGGFMLVRDSDGNYESIDFRETAPAAAFEDMYKNNVDASVSGGLASGVPGDLKGLEYLHRKYGRLSWRAVCNPAVHIARYGFPVTEDLVTYMNFVISFGEHFLTEDPNWAMDFAPNGTLLGIGDILTRKRYANTLEKIAKHGSKAFYEGEIAEQIIAAITTANGTMTLSDLKDYNISIRKTLSVTYRNYTLYAPSSPSSGTIALLMLKIIEGYNMSDPALLDLNTHRLDEAMRYAYSARGELGDPDFFGDEMGEFEEWLLEEKTVEKIRKRILDNRTREVREYGELWNGKGKGEGGKGHQYQQVENHGTSHIVTADESGMTVTSTSTVNLLFGSKLVVPENGIILNNEMNDFSIPGHPNAFGFLPSPINFILPHKRPLSSITPLIITHTLSSLPYISIGAAGGSRIPTSTVLSIWHVLDHNMTLPEALMEPRFHDQLVPARTTFEWGFRNKTVESLRELGHNVSWVGGHESAVQGVRWLGNGTFEAAGEPRQRNSGGLAV